MRLWCILVLLWELLLICAFGNDHCGEVDNVLNLQQLSTNPQHVHYYLGTPACRLRYAYTSPYINTSTVCGSLLSPESNHLHP
jgi:hypothetical protein